MNQLLLEQLVGYSNPCKIYSQEEIDAHYIFLREADEFSAASSLYIDEKYELLANAAHRYQYLVDKAVEGLNLDTEFLSFGKICFNFYSDIATRFGLGTQAYTTESKPAYIGISELSLQDLYLIQLIIIHEMQHARDFTYFNGLNLSIAERELRSRLSICKALSNMKNAKDNKLYKNAVLDQAFWYIILFLSPKISDEDKHRYYNALEPMAQKRILLGNEGIIFPPILVRVLNKELQREDIILSSKVIYRLMKNKGKFVLREEILQNLMPEPATPENEMEEIILEDNEPLANFPTSGNMEKKGTEPAKVASCNKMIDWHVYEDQYKLLKQNAAVIVSRDIENYNNVMGGVELTTSDGKELPIFLPIVTSGVAPDAEPPKPEVEAKEEITETKPADPTEFTYLNNISIPDAALETNVDENSIYQTNYNIRRKAYKTEDTIGLAEGVMSNLSEIVKKKGLPEGILPNVSESVKKERSD